MSKLNRRQFAASASIIPAAATLLGGEAPGFGSLTDVEGVRVGHFTDTRRPTGCTVVLVEAGAVAGVDVRGSAPGTRETDLLNPINTVQQVHAILLSGGSAFGLDAAGGVVRYLEERGVGFPTGAARVPIVPAAILYDLHLGDASIRPDAAAGYKACLSATDGRLEEGNVGAGAGATVGKLFGPGRGMKSGLGTASFRVGDLVVAAMVAVNAMGDVIDPETGSILAGARDEKGDFIDTARRLREGGTVGPPGIGENTTLAVVATNASFDKAGMTKVAQMSHDGFARAINPVHMPFDGDTAFALSTGKLKNVSLGTVGALAADVTARAITRAVLTAVSVSGFPAARDLRRK